MREIKFRVWDKKRNTFLVNIHNGIDEYSFDLWDWADEMSTCLSYPDQTYVFQQYTGIKDKNDKEIYEGDIVHHTCENSILIGYIEFFAGIFFISYLDQTDNELGYLTMRDIEVVGNIFENQQSLYDKFIKRK